MTDEPYPPIGDQAFIGDCHSAALIARDGSIDWCCVPRLDDGSTFGLLDWDKAGYCRLAPTAADTHFSRARFEPRLTSILAVAVETEVLHRNRFGGERGIALWVATAASAGVSSPDCGAPR